MDFDKIMDYCFIKKVKHGSRTYHLSAVKSRRYPWFSWMVGNTASQQLACYLCPESYGDVTDWNSMSRTPPCGIFSKMLFI